MSTQVFPSLLGLGWSIKRKALWKTTAQENVSGKEVRIAYWSSPRYEWELTFEFLRQGTVNGQAASDFAGLMGFFNLRQGMFDSFLYADPDDNATPTDQLIGTGDGATQAFQLVSAFGGYVQPILAPNAVANVKVGGIATSSYTLAGWGASAPG